MRLNSSLSVLVIIFIKLTIVVSFSVYGASEGKIYHFTDPILGQKLETVNISKSGFHADLELMNNKLRSLAHIGAVGIAANQLGKNKRMFIMVKKGQFVTIINPEIVKHSDKKLISPEGCLSDTDPHRMGFVERSESIQVLYYTTDGKALREELSGFEAVIFQHEIDHLNGIKYIDKAIDTYDNFNPQSFFAIMQKHKLVHHLKYFGLLKKSD